MPLGKMLALSAAARSSSASASGMQDRDSSLVPPPTPSNTVRSASLPGVGAPRAAVGVSTIPNVGKGGENQDSFVASTNQSGSKCLVGVFDGHGEKGARISQLAKSSIARGLFTHKELHSDPVCALEGAYSETQRHIERQYGSEALHSGTTAVAAYQHRDRLIVANVGDSRAVLGRCETSNEVLTGGSSLRAIELSSDQRPGRADERRRITQAGGVVQQSAFPVRQSIGGPSRLVRVGPERVWDRSGCYGLGVARSLGDLAMHPFVTANPELHDRQIDPKDKVLILGTDGVWDRLRSQEAVDIAARHQDPTAAAREITDVAKRRWHQETQGQVSDDITAVVVRLEYETGARSGTNGTADAGKFASAQRNRPGTGASDAGRERLGAWRPGSVPGSRQGGSQRRSRKAPLHNWKGGE
mmetsp:Transcript_116889/g.212675  ORF Transcript_116889/g.212675 Transcript_116889/m.212675 type:complete len:415 (-) Transcript_116889:128-1372(-)